MTGMSGHDFLISRSRGKAVHAGHVDVGEDYDQLRPDAVGELRERLLSRISEVQHVEAPPVPSPVGLVVKNGWNSLSRYLGGMPVALSRTRISRSSRRQSCRSGVRALLLVRLPASANHRGGLMADQLRLSLMVRNVPEGA
jgi:hypothetical protein